MYTCITILLVVGILMYLAPGVSRAQKQSRPNVLLILVDDLRPAIRSYGDQTAITPNLDRFGRKAMSFHRAYSNQAVCVASRYNLLLGSRSTSTGLYDFGREFRDFYPDAVTLPQLFKNNGYSAEAIGKVFHVGHNTYNDTSSWSKPHYKDLVIEYVDPESKSGGMTREEALFDNYGWDYARALQKGKAWESPDVEDEAYGDGRVARKAVERLQELSKRRDQPFFLAVGFARPHLPFSVPGKYWDLYNPDLLPMPGRQENPTGAMAYATKRDGEIEQYTPLPSSREANPFSAEITRKLIHGYYAGVSFVDVQIGKVLRQLEVTGLDKNTIVVVWGDHGYFLGELGMWTKHVNYELANRIPLMIHAPNVSKKGARTSQLVETVDVYPTLAELAGLLPPKNRQPIDGASLIPVLRNPDAAFRDHAYHSFPRGGKLGRAIRTPQYRLVEWKKIGEQAEDAEIELYDYSCGLVEERNIASERPEVVDKLREILRRHPEAMPLRPAHSPRK